MEIPLTDVTTCRGGRHRAPVRPANPLSGLSLAKLGTRRGVLTVASSSLAITMAATSAAAAPETTSIQAQPRADQVEIAAGTEEALGTVTVTTAAGDASQDYDAEVTAEAAPEPEPEPEVAPEPEPAPEAAETPAAEPAEPPAAQTAEAAEEPAPEPAPAASGIGAQIVSIARQYVGTPYVSGGSTPAGFDCSGFTQYVFAQVGISLPRTSGAQAGAGRVVSAAEAQPGDLVAGPGHVGIYTGNGQHIAARSPGTPLHESQIWMSNPTFIRVAG